VYKILLPLILAVTACKEGDEQSETKSLENLAAADGSKLTENACEGPYINKEYAGAETFEVPKELESEFNKALSSIPLGMRETFSTQMIGKIVVSNDPKTACKNATVNLSEERLKSSQINTLSCLRSTPGEPGVELIIPADKKSLRHTLVRGFFAAVFSTMSESEYNSKLKIFVAGKADPELADIKKALVVSLRLDLEKAKAEKGRLEQLFGPKIASLSEAKAIESAYDAMSSDFRDSLSLSVIRETADQYYCSKKTREVMRDKYIATYRTFKSRWVTPTHELIEEKTPEEFYGEKTLALTDESSAGLSLWGRWGAGNGPLRAWGASRMDARQSGGVGLFPNWNLARQSGFANGGVGAFPNWQLSRQNARQELQSAGFPGTSLFPNFWANRVLE
jgi:hypothetical protein